MSLVWRLNGWVRYVWVGAAANNKFSSSGKKESFPHICSTYALSQNMDNRFRRDTLLWVSGLTDSTGRISILRLTVLSHPTVSAIITWQHFNVRSEPLLTYQDFTILFRTFQDLSLQFKIFLYLSKLIKTIKNLSYPIRLSFCNLSGPLLSFQALTRHLRIYQGHVSYLSSF